MNRKQTILCKTLLSALLLAATTRVTAQPKVITLDLQHPTRPAVIEMNDEGAWTETFNTAEEYKWIEFGLFRFSHMANSVGGTDVGDGMSYWDGFTVCDNGDNSNRGEGNSGSWIRYQWGNMAAGGIMTDEDGQPLYDEETHTAYAEWGLPYLVAYWGFNYGETCLQVQFTDNKPHRPLGVYINNHPWPFYGNQDGDSFASRFSEEGDYFKVIAHGVTETGEENSVELMLAEYSDGELHQSEQWEWLNLEPLGEVKSIYFTLESSDMDPKYGLNTAAFFCLDKLQVLEYYESDAPERPSGVTAEATETSINVGWKASEGATAYEVSMDDGEPVTTTECCYKFENLTPMTEHHISIVAIGENGKSDAATITVSTIDITPPSVPVIVSCEPHLYGIDISWQPSEDNVGVDRYTVYVDGEAIRRIADTKYMITGLEPATTYQIAIDARDASGNYSEKATVEVTTLTTDGIVGMKNEEIKMKVYDLSGRKAQGSGLWIVNGKKIIVK